MSRHVKTDRKKNAELEITPSKFGIRGKDYWVVRDDGKKQTRKKVQRIV